MIHIARSKVFPLDDRKKALGEALRGRLHNNLYPEGSSAERAGVSSNPSPLSGVVMTRLPLFFALSSALLLAGCASSPNSMIDPGQGYDPAFSRANNIAAVYGLTQHPDQAATADGEGPVTIGSRRSSRGPALGGVGIGGFGGSSSFGVGLGLTFSMGPDAPEACLVGSIPESEAPTKEDARKLFIDRFMLAMKEAVLSVDPEARVTYSDDDKTDLAYDATLDIVSDVLGCKSPEEKSFSGCDINIATLDYPTGPRTASPNLGGKAVSSWIYENEYLHVRFHEGMRIRGEVDWNRVAAAAAKFLPANTYLSMPELEFADGTITAPFIVEKGRVNSFTVDMETYRKQAESRQI